MNHVRQHVYVELPPDGLDYLAACSRIRHISCTRLVQRLLDAICEDQLVLSVLDDDSKAEPQLDNEESRSRHHRIRRLHGSRAPW